MFSFSETERTAARDRNRTFSYRLPVAWPRIPAPRPGNANRRMGASGSSFHSASPSSSLLSPSPGIAPRSGDLGCISSSSSCSLCTFDCLRPHAEYRLKVMRLKKNMQWAARARGGARQNKPEQPGQSPPTPPSARRGCPPGRLARPCPGGAPIEKNGPFRWAVEGFWGLQTGYGIEKRPSRQRAVN